MTYTYKCEKCGHVQDEQRRMDDRDLDGVCNKCEGTTNKIFTANFMIRPGGGGHSGSLR